MMRELFRKRMGLAVLAGLGLSSLAATSANAALITFELRPTSPTTFASEPAVGTQVTFDIYAVIANGDGNKANDGFNKMDTAFISVEPAGGVQGNLAPATFNTPFLDAGVSTPGTQMNRDGNADLEVGGADPAVAAGWVSLTTGTTTKFATGTTGNAEFLLGSSSWSYSGGTGSTDLNLSLRLRTTGTVAQQRTVNYTADGVLHSERSDDTDIMVGTPITVTVNAIPEPAALGVLGLGALAALRRRRA